MGYAERKELIARLEKQRNSRVIAFLHSDRPTFPPGIPGFSVNLDMESHVLLVDHLRAIGKQKQIDLFLYTRGGNTDAVWPLVSLLREYCERLAVIVPFRAHSAGTLICLGADEIVMTDWAELSPIDPTTGNQFNPAEPSNPQARLGISVEDVAAYFQLAEDRAKIKEEASRAEVLKELTRVVHPLALGNVQRVYMMIRRLATRLLVTHLGTGESSKRIEKMVKGLTEEFYSHVHAVTRKEASELLGGDWVRAPSKEEAPLVTDLFDAYAGTLELRNKFSLPEYMGDQPVRELSVPGGFLDSSELSHVHLTKLKVSQRPQLPPGVQLQIPAGAPVPLGPWVQRAYDYGLQEIGWRTNDAQN